MNLSWSELRFAIKPRNLCCSSKHYKVWCIVKIPVLMSPVFSSNTNTCSCFINNERNFMFCSVFSNLLIKRWCCKVSSEKCNWLYNDSLYWIGKSPVFNDSLKLFETFFLLHLIIRFIIHKRKLQNWCWRLNPIKSRNPNTSNRFIQALACKSF